MPSLLEQLIREHDDEAAAAVAARLGIPREAAADALPAAAAVLLERFDPEARSVPDGEAAAPPLEGILGGTGEQVSERVGTRLGISPDQAAAVIPVLLPLILRFLARRVPGGGVAISVLQATVERQGYGSLDELAVRLMRRGWVGPDPAGSPGPSLATRLGRLAGKWFPRERD